MTRALNSDIYASTTDGVEICDNRIDDNGDGRVDGCWDPGSNYQPTGTIYYVAPNGNDSNDGSEARPFKTFAKATSMVKHHPDTNKSDALYVKSGTYNETINMQFAGTPTRPIVVRGVGATKPVIRVGGGNVGHIEPKSNTIVDNFVTDGIKTYTDAGHGLGGYGIFMSNVQNVMIDNTTMQQHEKGVRAEYGKRLIVRNSLIKDCEWGTYIGTDNDNGFSPEFEDTLWENVEAAKTAYYDYYNTDGFLIEGYSAYHVFRNCKAHGWTDAGFDLKPHVIVENSMAYDNTWTNGRHTNGHGFKIWRDGIVRNSIAYNNKTANFLYGGYLPNYKMIGNISYNGSVNFEDRQGQSDPGLSAQSIKISHNIFLNSNINDEIGDVTGVSALKYADHNLYFGGSLPNEKGANAKVVDPKLTNVSAKNFRPLAGSPAIDGGSQTLTQFMAVVDFDGKSRKIGSAIDIGPFEYGSAETPSVVPSVTRSVTSRTPTISRTIQPSPIASTATPRPTVTSSTLIGTAADKAPVFTLVNPRAIYQDQSVSFRVIAKDPEGKTVKYSAVKLPDGASFSGRTFSWRPNTSQSGSYQAIFKATDPNGHYSTLQVDFKVMQKVGYYETRWLNVENSPEKPVSYQVCRRSSYSSKYTEVITFSDGSNYHVINEEGRSACTNFYAHTYKPGVYLMTLYLCEKDSSGNLVRCFPNRATLIKR